MTLVNLLGDAYAVSDTSSPSFTGQTTMLGSGSSTGLAFGATAQAKIYVSADTTTGALVFQSPNSASGCIEMIVNDVTGASFGFHAVSTGGDSNLGFAILRCRNSGIRFTSSNGATEICTIRGDAFAYKTDQLSVTASGTTVKTLLTVNGPIVGGSGQSLSGAGAVNTTTLTTRYTSTGAAQALTLANGTEGQIKTILHIVDGGSGVLTPNTASGFTTITFTNVGDAVTLQYNGTGGWFIIGIYGAVAA